MYPLFETLQVKNGVILNQEWHEARYYHAYQKFYDITSSSNLIQDIQIPLEYQRGIVKLKIAYNQKEQIINFQHYPNTPINTLKIVYDNTIDYSLKYSDRNHLNRLVSQKEDCDNILIVKNNRITDTSFTNIIFYNGNKWFTPSHPLLKGTCRANLLNQQLIYETEIQLKDLSTFKGFQLINALRLFDPNEIIPINNIKF